MSLCEGMYITNMFLCPDGIAKSNRKISSIQFVHKKLSAYVHSQKQDRN